MNVLMRHLKVKGNYKIAVKILYLLIKLENVTIGCWLVILSISRIWSD